MSFPTLDLNAQTGLVPQTLLGIDASGVIAVSLNTDTGLVLQNQDTNNSISIGQGGIVFDVAGNITTLNQNGFSPSIVQPATTQTGTATFEDVSGGLWSVPNFAFNKNTTQYYQLDITEETKLSDDDINIRGVEATFTSRNKATQDIQNQTIVNSFGISASSGDSLVTANLSMDNLTLYNYDQGYFSSLNGNGLSILSNGISSPATAAYGDNAVCGYLKTNYIQDASDNIGTEGQLLSSTASGIKWVTGGGGSSTIPVATDQSGNIVFADSLGNPYSATSWTYASNEKDTNYNLTISNNSVGQSGKQNIVNWVGVQALDGDAQGYLDANSIATLNTNLNTGSVLSADNIQVFSSTENITIYSNSIVPSSNTATLGTPEFPFNHLYVTNGSISIGDAVMSSTGTSINLPTGTKIGTNTALANKASSDSSIVLGANAGAGTIGGSSIAIGDSTAYQNSGPYSVAIGNQAGAINSGLSSTSIGNLAGASNAGEGSLALGASAGNSSSGKAAVAIGENAGFLNSGDYSISIGHHAGDNSQGARSIAIGPYAKSTQPQSIILNAPAVVSPASPFIASTSGFFVNPVRINPSTGADPIYSVAYDASTCEIIATNPQQALPSGGLTGQVLVSTGGSSAAWSPQVITAPAITLPPTPLVYGGPPSVPPVRPDPVQTGLTSYDGWFYQNYTTGTNIDWGCPLSLNTFSNTAYSGSSPNSNTLLQAYVCFMSFTTTSSVNLAFYTQPPTGGNFYKSKFAAIYDQPIVAGQPYIAHFDFSGNYLPPPQKWLHTPINMTKSPVGPVGNFYNESLLKMSISTSSVQGAKKDCFIVSEAGVIVADGTNPPYRQPFILTGASIQGSYLNGAYYPIISATANAIQQLTPALNQSTLLLTATAVSITQLTLTTSGLVAAANYYVTIVNQNLQNNPLQTTSVSVIYPTSTGGATSTYVLPLNQSITFNSVVTASGSYLIPQ